MKELKQARHILGMRIERNCTSKTLWLSQFDYIHKVLKRFNMDNAKPISTPLLTTNQLSDRDSPSIEEERKLNGKIPYASAVGSIMYAMVATRPDLAYAVGPVQVKTKTKALGGRQTHPQVSKRNQGCTVDLRIEQLDRGRRLHRL